MSRRQHPLIGAFRRSARGSSDLALIDGWHLLRDAVDAGIEIDVVAMSRSSLDMAEAELIAQLSKTANVVEVSPSVLEAMSPVRSPSGVVALIHRREIDTHLTPDASPALIVVGVDIQDPGNAGAIVRAAEAAGATGVVLSGASADAWSWKALRAAMGSTFRLPVIERADVLLMCAELRAAGIQLVATVPRGGTLMYQLNLRISSALLLGAEGSGLPQDVLDVVDEEMSIPMQPAVESLNVAVATGILVYEARRQRQHAS